MSFPSDSSKNIYCPSQAFGTRMVMIPSVRRPSNILPVNWTQSGLNYQIIRCNSPAQYQQIMNAHSFNTNLHGNEDNTNVKSAIPLPSKNAKNSEFKSGNEKRIEEPVNLTANSSSDLNSFSSSSKISVSEENESKNEEFIEIKSPKKEPITPPPSQTETGQVENEPEPEAISNPRSPISTEELLIHERELEGWMGHVKPVPGIPRQAGSKREEVLKAAKSLFSKRTRTLYHWLYPSTSKSKLKATVAAAWDTLSIPEKDFYISQVLGRFGVPAGSLMVNPQLGGFKAVASGSSTVTSQSMDETGRAVKSLLLSEDDVAWTSYPRAQAQEPPTKRRRRHAKNSNGEASSSRQNQIEDETLLLKQIHEESLEDDFADDPELRKEFQQFRDLTHGIDSSLLNQDLDGILNAM